MLMWLLCVHRGSDSEKLEMLYSRFSVITLHFIIFRGDGGTRLTSEKLSKVLEIEPLLRFCHFSLANFVEIGKLFFQEESVEAESDDNQTPG